MNTTTETPKQMSCYIMRPKFMGRDYEMFPATVVGETKTTIKATIDSDASARVLVFNKEKVYGEEEWNDRRFYNKAENGTWRLHRNSLTERGLGLLGFGLDRHRLVILAGLEAAQAWIKNQATSAKHAKAARIEEAAKEFRKVLVEAGFVEPAAFDTLVGEYVKTVKQ